MTETNYKVLKENPIAQMVVYCTDKLPATYHTSYYIPLRINLQVTRGDKGFGEVTNLFQAQLTDDLSDIEVPCSGAHAHELWQTPTKPIDRGPLLSSIHCGLLPLICQKLLHWHHGRRNPR